MPNEFVTTQNIARAILPRLIDNLVFPNLVHKDYSKEFTGKGAKILVRKPIDVKAYEFDEAQGVIVQDINETSVEVRLDKIATVDVEVSAIEGATIADIESTFINAAAVKLAEKINADGLALYKDIPYVTGTAGTTPSTLDDLADARKQLNAQKVPTSGRVAVWDVEADANFTTIPAIVNAEKSGKTTALREGSIGRVFGLDNYMSQAVKTHTTGITKATAVKINGATEEGDTTLSIDGTTLTGKLVAGDVLKIGSECYTVTTETVEAASNAIAGISVYPALKAYEDDTPVELIGNHTANLAFNPNAFAFVTRPLVKPAGVDCYVTSYNGITLRVVRSYNATYKREMLSVDVLYGYKTMYPELACRVLG